jgi:hypothetical protein
MGQVVMQWRRNSSKSPIQLAGQDGIDLERGKHVMHLKVRVRLVAPESAKAISNETVPRYRGRNSNPERADLSVRNSLRTSLRFFGIAQNLSCVRQEELACSVQADAPRQSVEKREAKVPFQILDLARQSRLRNTEPRRRTAKMLFLSNRYKIS